MAYPYLTQVASSTPFIPTGSNTETNVQDAIVTAATLAGQARYALIYGYNGNSTPSRYLEIFQNTDSNDSPYVIPQTTELVSLSVSVRYSVASSTFTVYKNGSSVATLSISSSDKAYSVLGTAVSLTAGDEIAVAHTSGNNVSNVIFAAHFKVPF
jgi:hypothetical protein